MRDRPFDPARIRWNGCLAGNARQPWVRSPSSFTTKPANWFEYALPAINQNGPSCVGQAWANWMECMLRKYLGPVFPMGKQIEGELIWRTARKMFWGGNLDGGLYLHQGFAAMMELGILPPGSQLVALPAADWDAVSEQLVSTPIVQSHHIHPGWFRPDPVSGLIGHASTPGDSDGYHATLLVGTGMHDASAYRVGLNSWGTDYAHHGFFVMTDAEWFEGICPDGLYTASLPANWTEWTGWKKAVVEVKG